MRNFRLCVYDRNQKRNVGYFIVAVTDEKTHATIVMENLEVHEDHTEGKADHMELFNSIMNGWFHMESDKFELQDCNN